MDGWLRKGRCEDLSMDTPPDENKTDDEPERLEDDSSAAWEHETRQIKRKLEMQPSSSSSLARPREVKQCCHRQMKNSEQESRAVFLSRDVTSSASQQIRVVNRPGQFVANQLIKRKVEVR